MENGTVLRARVPPVDGLPDPPADTALLKPSHLTVSKPLRPGERWLDGYRRVLSTAARGKPFKRDRRTDGGARVSSAGLSTVQDCQCQQRLGVCLSVSMYADS